MAADYVVVTKTNRPVMGNALISVANDLRNLRDKIDAVNDAAQHMVNGGDHTLLEQQFGVGVGAGANLVTLLGLINTILNTSSDVTGANRLAQLDEFVARIAGQ